MYLYNVRSDNIEDTQDYLKNRPPTTGTGKIDEIKYFEMNKDFNSWNERKKSIHEKIFRAFVHEREIWWCSLGINVGNEEDGKNESFERPVLVLKKFNKDTVLIIPLTTKVKENKYHFPFTHENIKFAVILSQIRLVSTKRLSRRVRKIDHNLFKQIKQKIIEV